MPLDILVDRNLGTKKVPNALRCCGCTTRTLADVWGADQAQTLPDEDWIAWAAGRDVVVLTADERVRTLPAFRTHPIAVFALPNGNMQGDEQAARFVGNLERMRRIAEEQPRPFLAVCYRDDVRVKSSR